MKHVQARSVVDAVTVVFKLEFKLAVLKDYVVDRRLALAIRVALHHTLHKVKLDVMLRSLKKHESKIGCSFNQCNLIW
jgi:hypothetical protein